MEKYLIMIKAIYNNSHYKDESHIEKWLKCPQCTKVIHHKEIDKYYTCSKCQHNFKVCPNKRIEITVDEGTFQLWKDDLATKDPLQFPGYKNKLGQLYEKFSVKDGVTAGIGKIKGVTTVICIMDYRFIMGSMGTIEGEKITRAFERATEMMLPIVVFTVSGGARMQEGIHSLMQMAKISSAVAKHSEKSLLFISVLTNPTLGGVSASFAMQADVIIAEPNATIGFAGKKVINGVGNCKYTKDFQKAEFVLESGFIDKIVTRQEMREVLGKILKLYAK